MKSVRRSQLLWIAICIIGLCAGAAQGQQPYPSSPVRLIVPFSTGGGTDVVSRIIAQELAKSLGQPVLVENRPGADGIVGTVVATQAPPDGYTLVLVLQATLALNPGMYKAATYQPTKDFTPISLVSQAPYVIVVNPGVQANSLRELISLAQKPSSKLNYASGAAAAMLAMELLKTTAQFPMTHIPYKGSGPAISDLLSGRVGVMISSPVSVLPHIKAGKLRPLAVTSLEHTVLVPNVPSVAEQGYAGFEVTGWYGIAGPVGMPKEIIGRLNKEIRAVVHRPDVKEKLVNVGAEGKASSPEEFADYIKSEVPRWAEVMKAAGIVPQ